jgi:uncharacterized protein (DUF3084 family)
MKTKSVILFLFAILAFSSCNRKELERLKQENEQMQQTLEQRDGDVNNMISILNDIEENLANIHTREERVLRITSTTETRADKVDYIKHEIMAIDELMRKNRENLELLTQRLKTTTGEKQQLEKMIANLHTSIANKDREIQTLIANMEELNVQISDLYGTVSNLEDEKSELGVAIKLQEREMNQRFYIIGDRKALREQEMIVRKGGVLGMGKVDKLTDNPDPAQFTAIDLRENTIFPIDARKAELLTVHPSDSYIIRSSEDGKRLVSFEITLPEEFWKASKFMVLALD